MAADFFRLFKSFDLRVRQISTIELGVSWREFLKPVHCWSFVTLTVVLTPLLDMFVNTGNEGGKE